SKADADDVAEEFGELVLSGLDNSFACRDAPDDVIKVAEANILLPDGEPLDEYRGSVEIESSFGVQQEFRRDFFPASALQGSFLLELCKVEHAPVEKWLTPILSESNNVALVAVVASVASAYTQLAAKAAVSLLTSKDLIDLDRSRSVAEMQGQFRIPLPSAQQ